LIGIGIRITGITLGDWIVSEPEKEVLKNIELNL
jgi:hypothetical protein